MGGVRRFDGGLGLAAGATVENLVAGTFLERLGVRPEIVSVFAVTDTPAAANQGLFTCDIRLGNVIVADRASVPGFTNLLGPNRSDHLVARAVGVPFDLLQIRLFNGGALIMPYRFLVEATPM